MRVLILVLGVLVLLFALWWGLQEESVVAPEFEAASPAAAPDAAALPGEGATTVTGFALDLETGDPLVDAEVRGTTSTGKTVTARTDEQGRYVLHFPEGATRVTELLVRAEGYFDTDGWGFKVTPDGRGATVWVERIRKRVPGRVVDWRGRPVGGVTVRVDDETLYHSDQQGCFGPVPVGPDIISFEAWGDARAGTAGSWIPYHDSWPAELEVRMRPTSSARVRVIDREGKPVAGAVVRRDYVEFPHRMRTGADGCVEFPLEPFQQELLIASHGVGLGAVHVRGGGAGTIVLRHPSDPDFRPPREPSSAGPPPPGQNPAPPAPPPPPPPPVLRSVIIRVTSPDGRPLPGAEVRVRAPERKWKKDELTDTDGVCRMEAPSGEPLRVYACWGLIFSGGRDFTLPGGGEAPTVSLVLARQEREVLEPEEEPEPPSNRILVRVLSASGEPVPNATVEILGSGMGTTDEFGLAWLPGETVGAMVPFRVKLPGHPRIRGSAESGGPETTVRLLDRGTIRFNLVGERDERTSHFNLRIFTDEFQRATMLSAEDWGFSFLEGDSVRVDCPVGTWHVAFGMEPGEEVLYSGVRVRPGEETEVMYRFPRQAPLQVRLLDQDGQAVPLKRLTVAESSHTWEADESGIIDGAGSILSAPLPRPSGHLIAFATDGRVALAGPFDLWSPLRLDLRLGDGAQVTGRLVDPAGEPLGGRVAWQPAGGPLFAGDYTWERDGSFRLRSRIPAGPQTLVALVEGREPVKQVVLVPREGEVEVTIVVR